MELLILPQFWSEKYIPLSENWFQQKSSGLLKKVPNIFNLVDSVSKDVGINPRLLVTRMQLEQSAFTYKWNGTTKDYGGNENLKLKYLCGVDRTDSGDRDDGWFYPERQLLGCALRFKYWYRGKDGPKDGWENWLGLKESSQFMSGVPITRNNVTIIPKNQISADCLRYTNSMTAQFKLREVSEKWFPKDFQNINNIKIILGLGKNPDKILDEEVNVKMENGELRGNIVSLLENLDYVVYDRVQEQNKIYVEKKKKNPFYLIERFFNIFNK